MKLTLPTPYDDIVPATTTDAEALEDGSFRITEIVAAGILVPGDIVSAEDGLIIGFLQPAQVHVWELQYPPAWANDILRIEERAARYALVGPVQITTTVSICVVSAGLDWLTEVIALDQDIEAVEQLRTAGGEFTLDSLIAHRYPNEISMEELDFDAWLNEED